MNGLFKDFFVIGTCIFVTWDTTVWDGVPVKMIEFNQNKQVLIAALSPGRYRAAWGGYATDKQLQSKTVNSGGEMGHVATQGSPS